MRSISLTWTKEITDNEAIIFISTVHEALKIAGEELPRQGNLVPLPKVRPFGDWVLQDADPEMDYASFEWYQDHAVDHQAAALNADRFLALILNEPWQQDTPHYDLSLVHQPLTDKSGRSVLGLATRGRAAVISVQPIRILRDTWRRFMLLRRQVAHYVGQTLAVPIHGSRQRAHCTNICAMRPAHTLAMLIAYSEQETNAETLYCEQCRTGMGQRIVGSHWGNN